MSLGMDARTGKTIIGWDHVVQSIDILLSTELGSRVQRRDYGSVLVRLLDAPQNQESIVDFYMAIAEALEPRLVNGNWYGEPRFHLTQVSMQADSPGKLVMTLTGNYFPNGHKNDYQRSSPQIITYSPSHLTDILVNDDTRLPRDD